MMERVGKFCKPLSNGLCNKQLAFGPEDRDRWHDSDNYLNLILLKLM